MPFGNLKNSYTGEVRKTQKLDFNISCSMYLLNLRYSVPPQQHVCKREEKTVLSDQQICLQEKNSSLDREDPENKGQQEKLCTSLEGQQLAVRQEDDTVMWIPACEESDHQPERADSGSTRYLEPKPKDGHQKHKQAL